jgi:hypothetical protein
LAYSYAVDEAGFVWRLPRASADSPLAQFSLSGIWPQSPGIAQAPRADQRDLLRVAAAVAAADRLSPRQLVGMKQTERQLHWQRDLRLRIALECPERWRDAARLAAEVLNYLTADRWELEFEPVSRASAQVPLAIVPAQAISEVALFSGGLDSAAGPLAREGGEPGLTAVSICGTPVRAAAQRNVIDHLHAQGLRLHWLPVEHQLRREAAWKGPKEMPCRSRGFLFLAIGAVVATILRAKRLLVYETGVGALNLEGEGHKAESMQHCGICTSCLFRRVALHGAPDPTRYRSTSGRSRNGHDLAVFEMLALRIQRWNQGFVDLLDADPDIGDAVLYAARFGKSPDEARTALVGAFKRYSAEVAEFFSSARPEVPSPSPRTKEVQGALFAGTR